MICGKLFYAMTVIPVAVLCATFTVIGTSLAMFVVMFTAFFSANPASFLAYGGNLVGKVRFPHNES